MDIKAQPSAMDRFSKRFLITLGMVILGFALVSPVPALGVFLLLGAFALLVVSLPLAIRAQIERNAAKKELQRKVKEQVKKNKAAVKFEVVQDGGETDVGETYSISVSVPNLDCIESCPFTGELLTCLSWPDGSKLWYANSLACARFAADLAQSESKTTAVTIHEAGIPRLETDSALILPTAVGEKPSHDGFAALEICPLTPTGRKPKYPIEIHFSAYSVASGDGSHGTLCYLPSGEVGKADIHYWQGCVRHTVSLHMKDGTLAPSYILRQSNFDETPVTIWREEMV